MSLERAMPSGSGGPESGQSSNIAVRKGGSGGRGKKGGNRKHRNRKSDGTYDEEDSYGEEDEYDEEGSEEESGEYDSEDEYISRKVKKIGRSPDESPGKKHRGEQNSGHQSGKRKTLRTRAHNDENILDRESGEDDDYEEASGSSHRGGGSKHGRGRRPRAKDSSRNVNDYDSEEYSD